MSLLGKFFQAIRSLLPSPLTGEQMHLLSQLDTHRIFVENVRSLLGVSHKDAVSILDTAVRQGVFLKKIGVMCPDGSIAVSADSEEQLPDRIHCFAEDDEGHSEEVDLPTQTLKKVVFYSLDESSESASYSKAS